MLEVEVKIKIDTSSVEPVLKELGFIKGTAVYECDTYFNGDKTDLKAADKALRIRRHEDLGTGKVKYVLNYKGPKLDESTMTREETQFEIPSFESGETVFNGLGFYAAGKVEKTRLHYEKDGMTCCLDKVTGLGEFTEIEIIAEEADYDTAVSRINGLLAGLGLSMKDTIRESYLSMLQNPGIL